MNRKGQALVLFIIFIPLLFVLFAFVYDSLMYTINKNKYISFSKEILKENLDYEEVKELYELNGYETSKLKYDGQKLYNEYEFDSTFGKIIKIDKYEIIFKEEV